MIRTTCVEEKKKRKEKTKDRRQKPSDPSGLRLGRLFWNQVKKKGKQRERAGEKKKRKRKKEVESAGTFLRLE